MMAKHDDTPISINTWGCRTPRSCRLRRFRGSVCTAVVTSCTAPLAFAYAPFVQRSEISALSSTLRRFPRRSVCVQLRPARHELTPLRSTLEGVQESSTQTGGDDDETASRKNPGMDDGFRSFLVDMDNDIRKRIGKAPLVFDDRPSMEEEIGGDGSEDEDGKVAASDEVALLELDGHAADPIEIIGDLPSLSDPRLLDAVNGPSSSSSVFTAEAEAPPSVVIPSTNVAEAPGVRAILAFAIPAIAVWLCGPILSLIDTAAVGIFAGTTHQAALAPAVAVTDYTGLLLAFMFTASTNIMAGTTADADADSASASSGGAPAKLISALKTSMFVGSILGASLFLLSRPMLRAIIGNDTLDPVVFSTALGYVRIRALGFPAAAVMGSAQAACIGLKDVTSPLRVLAAAAVVNFFTDVALVPLRNPLVGGAAGAAWATVFSQYVAVAFFVRWLLGKPSVADEITSSPGWSRRTFESMSVKAKYLKRTRIARLSSFASTRIRTLVPSGLTLSKKGKRAPHFSTRGMLHSRTRRRDLFRPPTLSETKLFWPYFLPVTTTSVGRVSSYIAKSHVVSACMGEVSMAAHQILLSIFYCLCPVADSLNLTGQSFVPPLFEGKKSLARSRVLNKTIRDFVKAGALFGGALSIITCGIPLFSFLLTKDAVVRAEVLTIVPLFTAIFGVHGIITAAEGVILGHKDLGFLAKVYGFFFAAVPYFMLRIKKNMLAGGAANLSNVWGVFLGYQIVRVGIFFVRLAMLSRRNHLEATAEEDFQEDISEPARLASHEALTDELNGIAAVEVSMDNFLGNGGTGADDALPSGASASFEVDVSSSAGFDGSLSISGADGFGMIDMMPDAPLLAPP